MAFPVRNCALIGRFTDPRVAESVGALAPHLAAHGVTVLVSAESTWELPQVKVVRVPEREIGAQADLVITVGGDGTLLYGAGLVARHGVPLLGINRGRLGFLTDVVPQDMLPCVDAALAGHLPGDERPLLAATVTAAGRPRATALALNDVVVQKVATGRMLDFETRVNGHYVNTHGADGFVVATATGSTAYALSCGGPIVEPHLDVLVLVPICPHTLSDRPIVLAGSSTIEIEVLPRPQSQAHVTCDGAVVDELAPGEQLTVRTAAERVTLLRPSGSDYYKTLRSKLHWGRGRDER
jgi:NAD+ kinase